MYIAVLIDLDNIKNENTLSRVFVELINRGEIIYKYGFYSNFNDKNVKQLLHQFGIVPIMYPSFAGKKSCSDISLTIKAMDLLSIPKIECFAIVSNDSDFISLSTRIREKNIKTVLITDNDSENEDMYKYFDEGINIFELLSPKPNENEKLISSKELSVLIGEKDEKKDTNNNQAEISINFEVDNIRYVNYDQEPDIIKMLMKKIESAFRNIAIENDFIRLSSLIENLNGDDSKFNPRDYGHINKKSKDFFEKRLGKYFDFKTTNSTVFIKFKEEVK